MDCFWYSALILAIFGATASCLTNMTVLTGPNCQKMSEDSGYDTNVAFPVTKLANETPREKAGDGGEHRSKCNYPDDKKGPATGGARCVEKLSRMDYWKCLVYAQGKLTECNLHIASSVELQDCKRWFKKT